MFKKLALIIAFSSAFWFQYTQIKVHENIEDEHFFKLIKIASFGLTKLSKLAENCNYGVAPSNMRYMLDGIVKLGIKQSPHVETINTKIAGVNVRIYEPSVKLDKKSNMVMIYYHGGGFFIGSSDMYNDYLTDLTKKLNSVIISVDYRLAPEHPYPAGINDCYAVTKYVLKSENEFGDNNRVILAGDSAGGNIVAVMTQKLKADSFKMPKLQILIYPWLQMFNNRMPSGATYRYSSFYDFDVSKFISYYLGYSIPSEELLHALRQNQHTLLVKDKTLLEKYKRLLDPSNVPAKYRTGKDYYKKYEIMRENIFPNEPLNSQSLLKKDKVLADKLVLLFTSEISPALADESKLTGLPRAVFVQCEIDPFKDEGLIYSERLRNAGVQVDVQFYENCFHGSHPLTDENYGTQNAKVLRNLLIEYIKNTLAK